MHSFHKGDKVIAVAKDVEVVLVLVVERQSPPYWISFTTNRRFEVVPRVLEEVFEVVAF